jgi:hypothetical protein
MPEAGNAKPTPGFTVLPCFWCKRTRNLGAMAMNQGATTESASTIHAFL